MSHFVRFEKLSKIFRTIFSTSHATMNYWVMCVKFIGNDVERVAVRDSRHLT